MTFARLVIVFLVMAMLTACSNRDRREQLAYVESPVEQLYNAGFEDMQRGRYDRAAQFFDEVERQHPFSEWARRSMVMAAYANYTSGRYTEAISDAERFIALHPGSENAPYAYYIIAVSHFEQIYDVGRDQATTQLALNSLEQVVRRYPDTPYASDARLKIDMTRDHLAGKEMSVGRWYLRNGYYLAAVNRFQNVIRDYQTTSHTPEALHRLVESYVSLGVDEEARQIASVLGYNFPGSEWYEDSYVLLTERGIAIPGADELDVERSLWQRARDRIFG